MACSPIAYVCKTIHHLIHCKAKGTLIVPKWPSAPYWTMIFKKGYEYQHYVEDILEFAPYQNIFSHGRNTNSLFGSTEFSSRVLAVKLNAEI